MKTQQEYDCSKPMDIHSLMPSKQLQGLIKEYVFMENKSNVRQTIPSVDDACYDFMFPERAPVTVHYSKNLFTTTDLIAYTHQFDPPTTFTFLPHSSYFVVKVQPWANALFFPSKAANFIQDLRPFYGDEIIQLHHKVYAAPSLAAKVAVADEYFNNLDIEESAELNLVRDICISIYDAQGMITVNSLAEQFSMDRQSLNKTFLKHVHYTTKKFIIFVRVLNSIKFKFYNPSFSMTSLAHEFGYFDQSHFIYDFKRISGVTPAQLFKRPPLFLQRHQANKKAS